MIPSPEIARLIEIMAALRAPETGCPWDLVQTFETIAPFTIEEAHEVADAIARKDMVDLCDELGDLLLQVVYHAQMAQEAGAFAFSDVVMAITTKLIRRHPHVFGDRAAGNPSEVKHLWEAIKAQECAEKAERKAASGQSVPVAAQGLLSAISSALPGFTRAMKLQTKASSVGFDWNDAQLVLDKIEEETHEVRAALTSGNKDAIEDEIGDLLFAAVNLARHTQLDPEACLQRTNAKFARRFSKIEAALAAQGRSLTDADLDEMERLWIAAKTGD
jgi:nucleoside triphosphate diphosphatase